MACAVFSLSWAAMGPAQADGGVGGAVGALVGTGGGAVEDTVDQVVGGALPGDTVDGVTQPVVDQARHAVVEPVRAVTQVVGDEGPSEPATESTSGTARGTSGGPAGGTSAGPAGGTSSGTAGRTSGGTSDGSSGGSAGTSAGPTSHASSNISHASHPSTPRRHRMHASRSAQERASRAATAPTRTVLHAPTRGATLQSQIPDRAAEVAVAAEPTADRACRSTSLLARDLRRCALADTLLPNLGGARMILLPISLALVSIGLVLAVPRRRRAPAIAPGGRDRPRRGRSASDSASRLRY